MRNYEMSIKNICIIKKYRCTSVLLLILIILFAIVYSSAYTKDTDMLSIPDIYKMKSFKRVEFFDRFLLFPVYQEVIPAYVDNSCKTDSEKFQNLVNKISDIEYAETPTEDIFVGANCQTLTMYIEDWCICNDIEYRVIVQPFHVFLKLHIDNIWYVIDFDKEMNIYNECTGERL